VDLREVVNGIVCRLREGCPWRAVPHDLPPWGTVHMSFRPWRRDGTWPRGHDIVRAQVRVVAGREPTPSARWLDSHSGKTTAGRPQREDHGTGGPRGDDAGKHIKGRQRHIAVDTQGWLLRVVGHPANGPDAAGAKFMLAELPAPGAPVGDSPR
jgi:putative transposase